jgi:hypothetical protein
MHIPDKRTYKATVTTELRNFIMSLGNPADSHYLEIGADRGYTAVSVEPRYASLTLIENDFNKVGKIIDVIADSVFNDGKLDKYRVIPGCSDDIPVTQYDVILIDADHSYEGVKTDLMNVFSKNTSLNFYVILHDYGLVGAGVKRAVQQVCELHSAEGWVSVEFDTIMCGMQKDWNPLGGETNDWEAVCIRVTRRPS